MKRLQLISLFFFLILSVSTVASIALAEQTSPYLPDPQLTPGAAFTDATRQEICVPGYAKRVRAVPLKVKQQVYREYGIRQHKPGEYEVDHLVPLGLGGSNHITNLWPEPYHGPNNAHNKDKLEDFLHQQVCAGNVPLQQARQEIQTNWIAAYQQYLANR